MLEPTNNLGIQIEQIELNEPFSSMYVFMYFAYKYNASFACRSYITRPVSCGSSCCTKSGNMLHLLKWIP